MTTPAGLLPVQIPALLAIQKQIQGDERLEAAVGRSRRSTRKPRGDGHLRRAEILAAAERIFVVDGYEGATIRRIAEEVGVSSTALYMHFRDKSCILLEICQAALEGLLQRTREIADRPRDAVSRVKLMLDSYMRFGLANPNAYRLVYIEGRPESSQWDEQISEVSAQCYQAFAGVVREIAGEGRLRTLDPDTAAQAMWTACHGTVSLIITRPGFEWRPHDEILQATLDGMFHGLVSD